MDGAHSGKWTGRPLNTDRHGGHHSVIAVLPPPRDQVRAPGAQTSITLVTWFPTMPAGAVKGTVLETDDLDGDVAVLRERGVRIDGGVQQAPWGRFVTFDDPDGNGLVLQATAGG